MLAVLPGKAVYSLIYPGHLFDLCSVIEKGILGTVVRQKAGKDNACLPVRDTRPEDLAEPLFQRAQQTGGICARQTKPYLHPETPEILPPEENDKPGGGKPVPPCLDAGVFEVLRQLGEDEGFVNRRRGKRPDLAYRLVAVLYLGDNRIDASSVEFMPDLLIGFGEVFPYESLVPADELKGGEYPELSEE